MRTIVIRDTVMTVLHEYQGLSMRRWTVRLDHGWWPTQDELVRLLDGRYSFGSKVEPAWSPSGALCPASARVTVYTA